MIRSCLFTLLLATVLTAVGSTAVRTQTFSVGTGEAVLLNGFFTEGEWEGASQLVLRDSVRLYAKQDENYLYIGIQTLQSTHTGLDFYMAAGPDRELLFHVSSAFADAVFENGSWSEWIWEQNRWWAANKIGTYYEEKNRRSSQPEGFEFQIDKAKIRWDLVYLAFHLKRPEYMIPSSQDREAFRNWIRLLLDQ